MRYKEKNDSRRIGGILLVLYIGLLCYFLLFCSAFGRNPGLEHFRYNLVPFREINRFYTYWKQVGFISAFLNMAGNIVGFVPLGILLPLVSVRMRRWKRILVAGFSLTLILEILQLVMKVGIFDVDDIILNTLGTLLGYLIYRICNSFRRNVLYG